MRVNITSMEIEFPTHLVYRPLISDTEGLAQRVGVGETWKASRRASRTWKPEEAEGYAAAEVSDERGKQKATPTRFFTELNCAARFQLFHFANRPRSHAHGEPRRFPVQLLVHPGVFVLPFSFVSSLLYFNAHIGISLSATAHFL